MSTTTRPVAGTGTAGVTTSGPSAASSSGTRPVDLASRLVATAPAGFVEAPPGQGLVGPLDASMLQRELSAPHAAELVADGFVRGYGRAWSAPVGGGGLAATRAVYVLEMRDAAGAARARDYTDEALGERDRATFAVPNLPGAVGRSWTQEVTGGPMGFREVAFVRGARLYVVQTGNPGSLPSEADVMDLAHREAEAAGG